MIKKTLAVILYFIGVFATAQQRDVVNITLAKNDKPFNTDTALILAIRVDTTLSQEFNVDTNKIVKDFNQQDLEESGYKVWFMGSARINAHYDFAGMKSTEGFMPFDIPIGKQDVPGLSSTYLGARQSRMGVGGDANTKVGKIKAYMEVDFASASDSYLRLRHAYAEWNFVKLGYTWSTFMDNASLPKTVEFEGPNSSLSKRHGLIRYERIIKTRSILGISLESPKADYYNPADTLLADVSTHRNLDLASRYKYFDDWGHVQVAGILRRIDVFSHGSMEVEYGWGVLFSSTLHLGVKHQINAQYSTGKGIAYYYVGFNGRQLDAVYNPNTNSMMLKSIYGGFINYSFMHNPSLVYSLICGISKMKVEAFEPADTFLSSQYLGINVFYNPIKTISLGLEATTGTRKNFDNQQGEATRISMMAKFDF